MTGLYVDPIDLRAKAAQIRGLEFTAAADKPALVDPDQLDATTTAVDNLRTNADYLYAYQDYGRREGVRLAETLDSVAAAYESVDEQARSSIDGTGGRVEPVVPQANSLDDPAPPASMGPFGGAPSVCMLIDTVQEQLSSGDRGASLKAAWSTWVVTGNDLQTASHAFTRPIPNWEGDAALQAYRKLKDFGDWLFTLGMAWHALAGEAWEMAAAHADALDRHTAIYERYKGYEREWSQAVEKGDTARATDRAEKMAECQRESDDLREAYALAANRPAVHPPEAPDSTAPTAAVTNNGTPPGEKSGGAGGSGGSQGGGGETPQQPTDPMTAQTSPASAESSRDAQGAGSQSGGGQSGSPSGGGGSGGGMPELPTGEPVGEDAGAPDYSKLEAAAADRSAGGGSGGGGAGGGGAGGAGPGPLQPSVGGVAVGPSPTAGGSAGAATPAAASAGGMMAGGMGGMAPMHAGGAQAGKEKQRSPGVAPDEELYSEDRPWTEGIIGRSERRAGQGKKDAT